MRNDWRDGTTSLLLGACDEFDAVAVLRRLGIPDADICLAERTDLLAGVALRQAGVGGTGHGRTDRRYARGDISTVATFSTNDAGGLRAGLRTTDEISERDGTTALLLGGCDEFDAVAVLHRLGVPDADVRLAAQEDLLAGPGAARRLGQRFGRASASAS